MLRTSNKKNYETCAYWQLCQCIARKAQLLSVLKSDLRIMNDRNVSDLILCMPLESERPGQVCHELCNLQESSDKKPCVIQSTVRTVGLPKLITQTWCW